jgi:predicted nucleotidyltransferase
MGSEVYGASNGNSDKDVYGFCIPPKEIVFPHLAGEIEGFGRQRKRFEQWQEHHVKAEPYTYDCTVYSIVKYFQLCMENNPNMIDSLFTHVHAVQAQTSIGQMVRDNRRLFLHKGAWHKFKGYAYSQLHKIETKERANPKRQADIDNYGYDLKFGYHLVRLMLEVEQILIDGDLDLTRHSDQLKAIRRGEWTIGQIKQFFSDKERQLEQVYHDSKLPHSPNEEAIKSLLLNCLEQHYGTLPVPKLGVAEQALQEIKIVLAKYNL